MSDFASNLGTYNLLTFSDSTPRRRMAGEYLREFPNKVGSGNTMNNSSVGNSSGSNNQYNINTAAVAAAQQSGGKKEYPTFRKESSKLTDYPELYNSSSNNTNAILPKDMQQDIINSGGKINDDGTYVHGSMFESSWNNRNSEEYKQAKATADATLYANAGVTNKEDYYKSDAFKAARARAVARSR